MNDNTVNSINSSFSFFDQLRQNATTKFENTIDFFNSYFTPSSHEEKKLPTIVKIADREIYDRKAPDELFKIIFNYIPYQTRLSLLPQVCYQFYKLSQPFSDGCYHIHSLIPKIKECIIRNFLEIGPIFYALNFKADQTLSVYKINPQYREAGNDNEMTKKIVACADVANGKLNVLSFIQEMHNKIGVVETKIVSTKISDGVAPNFEIDYNSLKIFEPALLALSNIDEKTIKLIGEVLLDFGQAVLLEDSNDLFKLKNELLLCFGVEEREAVLKIIKDLEENTGISMDQMLNIIMNDENASANIKKNIYPFFLEFVTVPYNRLVENLKQKRDELLIQYNVDIPCVGSLFILEPSLFAKKFQLPCDGLRTSDKYKWLLGRINK